MPHCIIEYSIDLEDMVEPSILINAVHNGAITSGLFEESHIKTRAHSYAHYKVGVGDHAFIHVTANILSGRTVNQKAELSAKILAELKNVPLSSVVVTVQICDIEKETYAKMIL